MLSAYPFQGSRAHTNALGSIFKAPCEVMLKNLQADCLLCLASSLLASFSAAA
uniref:Uncharacterized protein n=1 Tax=Rhizophora mucronata TaxID=61149 RepID=A0A2P2ILR7_RHIMU